MIDVHTPPYLKQLTLGNPVSRDSYTFDSPGAPMRGRARSSIKSDQAKNVSWSGVSKSCWADIAATPQPIGRLDPAVIHVQATDANVNHNSTTHDGESTFESLVSIHESSLENYLTFGNGTSSTHGRTYDKCFEQIIRPLSDYAEGYPRVAALENSDPNFLILRKFGDLHVRVLLHHQDELVELEDELDRLDCFDYEGDYQKLKSRRRDDAISPDHQKLLLEIEKKLAVYDELLLRYQQIHAIKRPTKRNQSSLYNFIRNTRSFVQSEGVWIERGEDLAALAHDEEHGWLASALEDALFKTSRSITQFCFSTSAQRAKAGTESVYFLSHERLNALVYACVTVIATALLLFPVFILYAAVSNTVQQLLVIFAFTPTFAACCSFFTRARKQEVFAATAAYCAVLVVFLGNSQSNRNSQR